MASPKQAAAARLVAERVHRGLADEIRRLREDAGLPRTVVASVAGIHASYLDRIEAGTERPSIETYTKLSIALGADLTARLYPRTGPRIRDRHQARILEFLLGQLGSRWKPYLEVGVRSPERGWIDAVIHDARSQTLVATEIQSDLRRIEQQLRWFQSKAESLPSWEGFAHLGQIDDISRLLVVRSTEATREIGRRFERQLAVAYPAHPDDAIAALRGEGRWPGAALVWVDVRPDGVRFVRRRVRG